MITDKNDPFYPLQSAMCQAVGCVVFLGTVAVLGIGSCNREQDRQQEGKLTSKYTQQTIYKVQENLSATRHEINGVEYLSIPIGEKEIKLFHYQGEYLSAERIRQIETQNAQKHAESNLLERLQTIGIQE